MGKWDNYEVTDKWEQYASQDTPQQQSAIPQEMMSGLMGAKSAVSSLPIAGQTLGQVGQAITNPMDALRVQGAVYGASNPIASTLAYLTGQAVDSPLGKQSSEISQSWASKIPKELMGHAEPTMGALGALGEIARRTTPDQYRQIPKVALATAAFAGGQQLQGKLVDWGNSIKTTMFDPMKGHKEGLAVAQDGLDIAKSAKSQLDNDIKTFYDINGKVPVPKEPLQQELNTLYGTTQKDVVEKLPEEFINDMGKIEVTADTNIGLVKEIKGVAGKHINWSAKEITPVQERLRRFYFNLDKIIDDGLGSAGLLEEKQHLDALNQVASEVYGDVSSVRQMTRGSLPQSKIPSPAGLLGAAKGDVQKREVLERLAQIEPKMKDLIDRLVKYSNSKSAKELLKTFGLKAAEYLPGSAVTGAIIKHL